MHEKIQYVWNPFLAYKKDQTSLKFGYFQLRNLFWTTGHCFQRTWLLTKPFKPRHKYLKNGLVIFLVVLPHYHSNAGSGYTQAEDRRWSWHIPRLVGQLAHMPEKQQSWYYYHRWAWGGVSSNSTPLEAIFDPPTPGEHFRTPPGQQVVPGPI